MCKPYLFKIFDIIGGGLDCPPPTLNPFHLLKSPSPGKTQQFLSLPELKAWGPSRLLSFFPGSSEKSYNMDSPLPLTSL